MTGKIRALRVVGQFGEFVILSGHASLADLVSNVGRVFKYHSTVINGEHWIYMAISGPNFCRFPCQLS